MVPWDTRMINANKLKYILARSCSIFSSSVCWPDGLRCYESHQRRNVTASVFLSYTYTLLIFRLSTSDEMMKRVLSATCRCIGWSGTAALTLFSQGRERQRRYCAAFKISQKSHGPASTPIINHYLAAFSIFPARFSCKEPPTAPLPGGLGAGRSAAGRPVL